MPSKVYAISNPSAAIALRYGKNVSKGILKMEDKIEQQERALAVYRNKKCMFHDCESDATVVENEIALCDYHEKVCDDAHELYHPDDGE